MAETALVTSVPFPSTTSSSSFIASNRAAPDAASMTTPATMPWLSVSATMTRSSVPAQDPVFPPKTWYAPSSSGSVTVVLTVTVLALAPNTGMARVLFPQMRAISLYPAASTSIRMRSRAVVMFPPSPAGRVKVEPVMPRADAFSDTASMKRATHSVSVCSASGAVLLVSSTSVSGGADGMGSPRRILRYAS